MARTCSWVVLALAGAAVLTPGCDRDRKQAVSLGPSVARAQPPATADTLKVPTPQTPEFKELVRPRREPMDLTVPCVRVAELPQLSADASDPAWARTASIETLDFSSQRPVTLRAVHDGEQISFLVSYPDAAPSTTHKSWLWDDREQVYKALGDREDMLVLKFSLSGNAVNMSFRDAVPHRADIWFWKACRTNPMGYADDKWDALLTESQPESAPVPSPKHGKLHLVRRGDSGHAAYEDTMPMTYCGRLVAGFIPQEPSGSRADIHAKGIWRDGTWTIQLTRRLVTGHDDDVQFSPGRPFLFGLSCYEIAYAPVDPKAFQPIYKTGDVFDRLMLQLEQ